MDLSTSIAIGEGSRNRTSSKVRLPVIFNRHIITHELMQSGECNADMVCDGNGQLRMSWRVVILPGSEVPAEGAYPHFAIEDRS